MQRAVAELGGQLALRVQLDVLGLRGRRDQVGSAAAQRVVQRDVAGQIPPDPAGHHDAQAVRRPPRQQRGDALLARHRAGVLVEPVDEQHQPPAGRPAALGGRGQQLQQPGQAHRGRRRGARRTPGQAGQLLGHRLEERVAVALAGQAGGDEEGRDVRVGRGVQGEPGGQRRLAGPCLGLPPPVGTVPGAERGQLGQLGRPPIQHRRGDVGDLQLVAGRHVLGRWLVGRRGPAQPGQPFDQALHRIVEPLRAQRHGLPADQRGQAGRQLLHPWQVHAQQHRDDPHPRAQRRLDLQPDEVGRIVQAPTSGVIDRFQPAVADQRQQHGAGRHRALDGLGEVVTRLDRVDVLEHPIRAEGPDQLAVDQIGLERGVLASVAQEDPRVDRRGLADLSGAPHVADPFAAVALSVTTASGDRTRSGSPATRPSPRSCRPACRAARDAAGR